VIRFALIPVLEQLSQLANDVLVFLHDQIGLEWGVAIIVLTFLTRLLIVPLSIKQIRSMRALQAFQPQIKEIQEKYKDDRQRMQREMMSFYQENQINPLASCFPLLLQLPVFLALYYALRSYLPDEVCASGVTDCDAASFLFIPSLLEKATGGVLVVLIILYVGTQLGAGMVMAATADRTQRMIMFGLPLVFVPIIINFPAGLVVYWITTNVWTVGQQFVVKKVAPPPAKATPEAVAQAKAAKPPPPPPRKRKKRAGRK
jgi:YidC/Oxa1 family membrane protein insertase